jgi:hypothetical protein
MELTVKNPPGARGVIFIPTLFAILVITSLIILLLERGATVSRVENAIKEEELLDGKIRSELADQTPGNNRCGRSSSASLTRNLIICHEVPKTLLSYPTLPLPPGVPDLTAIAQSIRPCPTAPIPVSGTRFFAPTSPHTCALDSAIVNTPLTVQENFRVTNLTISTSKLLVVASLGSISIDALIVSGGNLLLIAAGEIRVQSLSNDAGQLSKITLLAATGDIEVTTASSNLSLLLLGRGQLKAPQTPFAPPFALPNFRKIALLGTIPVNRTY